MPIGRLLDQTGAHGDSETLYRDLRLPDGPDERPYVVVNMVATVDGKTVYGPLGSSASGLGTATDRRLMVRIQENTDAAIIGAATLRAGHVVYPPRLWRAVLTSTGEVPLENRFFTDAPHRAVVFAPRSLPEPTKRRLAQAARVVPVGQSSVDPAEALLVLRRDFGVRRAVLEGGAAVNAQFFGAGLVDELFLTVAPKLKGGAHLPTVVDGPGLPDRSVLPLSLVSVYRDGDELYLRYRVGQADAEPSPA
jgi:2,5-diamino-6-(ribosylamino)-4(3H)-pyrimidinone 5'-phosphate reductase